MPTAEVPGIQKEIISRCHSAGVPVITATQMLESMIENPRPTRAEASDVANAIYDGTSAVMLSAETASGKFPVLTVQIMSSIIRQTEGDLFSEWTYSPNARTRKGEPVSIARASVQAAARGGFEAGAKAIAVFTESGFTARYLAGERLPIPMIAFTPNLYTVQRLALAFGIQGRKIKNARTSQAQIQEGEELLLEEGLVKKGDRVVMIFGSSPSAGFTNMVHIRTIGEAK
jgi:pyruvate kinase